MTESKIGITINCDEIIADNYITTDEAKEVFKHAEGPKSIIARYQGPREQETALSVSPIQATGLLYCALKPPENMGVELEEIKKALNHLEFDNSAHGNESVVEDLLSGHGKESEEKPVRLVVDYNESASDNLIPASSYAIIAYQQHDDTSAEEANLALEGNTGKDFECQQDLIGTPYEKAVDL